MQVESDIKEARQVREEKSGERKEHWRTASELEEKLNGAQDDLRDAQRRLKHTIPHYTAKGLDAVKKIAKELKLEAGVHGPIIDLITLRSGQARQIPHWW